ncbi:CLUMA_CG007607, isoform A [Clunio marinus]|uniref:CLUMA_CG007607, isoform A n=1 Tax=Clunio marinus TaxID=568069 RepID=A0A1J1I1J7_9DIPT|nr:CLUMA_CG007607, isoform A [Clunio marinus]
MKRKRIGICSEIFCWFILIYDLRKLFLAISTVFMWFLLISPKADRLNKRFYTCSSFKAVDCFNTNHH